MLAASPLAKGLFQGVICESGGSFAPAKTGDPNGSGLPQWPAFSGKHPLAMHFSDKPRADAYPNLEKLELWGEVLRMEARRSNATRSQWRRAVTRALHVDRRQLCTIFSRGTQTMCAPAESNASL